MSHDFDDPTSGISQENDTERRRRSSTQLRNLGFSRRQSLEKRGTLGEAAPRKLTERGLGNLHAALRDDDETVRLNAIIGAGDLGDATTVPHLESVCERTDLKSRLAAVISLGDIGGPRGVSFLARLARDPEEHGEIRFAALTEIEELVAKKITSGPDRRFDPAPRASSGAGPDDPSRTESALVQDLRSIESDAAADDLLRLKAADVRRYLEGGAA